ncbi:hypothetical protein [Psittacicella hinzii]|uniref:Peptidase S24/S26A/S26B/S26C domain-containing protein n=1 Tax=Psittacicella hinzii TaxID=2028575 RepID=A0A3A1YQF0_9GAMM|nr:hypothetical protein [Psittacicella hinzii]RIY39170.1 hypothetical protein CKF58_02710 [Psittacicella hinzii]
MTQEKSLNPNLLVDDGGQAIDLTNYAGFTPLVDLKSYRKTKTLLLEVLDDNLAPEITSEDVLLIDQQDKFSGDGVYALEILQHGKVVETQVLAYVDFVASNKSRIYKVHQPQAANPQRTFNESSVRFLGRAMGVIKHKA